MKKELVEVVFDRRKNSEKRGYGFLEVQVYLGRATRKYIMIGKYWLSGNLVGISINLCKSIQKELFINDTP